VIGTDGFTRWDFGEPRAVPAPDPSHPAGAGLVPDVRKVAVLRCNALGDLLMALPALAALAAAYPGAETTLLGGRWHARFLPGRFAPVHRVQVLPRVEGLVGQPADAPPAAELAGFLAAARAERYDVAVQLHGGGAQSNPVVGALGARVTAGLRADGAPPLDRTVPYRYYQSEQARYLEVVGLLGAPTCPPPVRLAELPADARRAEELLGPDPRRVALHVGAGDPRRRWPLERFAEVARALRADGVGVVAVGAPDDAPASAALAAEVPGVLDLTGRTDLGALAAVLRRCGVVVANDSGPLHLARAVGAATVGLYWCGNAINAAPATRTRHRPLLSWRVHCPVCGVDTSTAGFPHRPGEGCAHRPSFLDQIPVVEVLEEVRSLLAAEPAAGGPRLERTTA
jgi:ADP-heptose:LPS heptosyltransferase